jgi:demethylmenaquinone methyltransferase/2-methoxy-6-polyprenyl-1,4-benzoquinol methylase
VNSILPSIADKPRFVAEMFARIADRYDLMNTLITGGQDRAWRRIVAEAVTRDGRASERARTVLDVGTGTGKLGEAVFHAAPDVWVVGVDFTQAMLRAAPRRLKRAGADALQLPFGDAQFDAVVSAFLVRNLADPARGIAEQVRVLRPGGHLAVLETTPGPDGVVRPFFRLYMLYVVPVLGWLIAGDPSAYSYLPESTLAFVEPARLADLLRQRGLVDIEVRRLAFGCVAVTTARKPVG